MESEQKMIDGCRRNNRSCQKQLYDAYAPMLLGVCSRYAIDINEAEDWLHDAFMIIYTKIDKYKNSGNLGAWLRRLAINNCINNIRRKKFIHYGDTNEYASKFKEDSTIIAKLSYDEILFHISKLPSGYKLVFNLFAIEGFSHKEIAQQLEISESTSKTQYRNARLKLQEFINAANNNKR